MRRMTKWISRASVLRIIDADPVYSDVINEKTYMASQINNLPTKEETSRPHGEWEGEPERRKMVTRICTSCGDRSVVGYFCMWCGADMREGEAE